MLRFKKKNGFTLIELIAVIALISIMLFLAIPRFKTHFLSNTTKEASRWILLKIPALKEKAVREQKNYILHIDFDSEKLWISHDDMSEDEIQNARINGYDLPDDIKLQDVEFPGGEQISAGKAEIFFYAKGYSDKAVIHIVNEDGDRFSFLVEPFLLRVQLYDTHIGFEDV